ncbi:hypothetical protein ACTMTF_15410 [Nonomuraea sp. ZG12]|uniref:hypothetical protein n=1 Tax=Nonomuraea sp. ZG12 TaxID=3452207 RepID=UPI003F8C93F0
MKVSGEWELAPDELAAMFAAKGWGYDTEQGLTIPNADTIEAMLAKIVTEVLNNEEVIAVQGGRFMVWKDPDMPNSYDLFLNLGYIWDEDALGEEEMV